MKVPEKCKTCKFVKCRILQVLYEYYWPYPFSSKDVEDIYIALGLCDRFYMHRTTPAKILYRLRHSRWVREAEKSELGAMKAKFRGKLKPYVLSEKALGYLQMYGSFFKGPICRKEQRK